MQQYFIGCTSDQNPKLVIIARSDVTKQSQGLGYRRAYAVAMTG